MWKIFFFTVQDDWESMLEISQCLWNLLRKFQKVKFYFLYFPIFDNFCSKKKKNRKLIAKLLLIIIIIYVNFKGYFYKKKYRNK